jgi:hypothetical protein
VQREEEHFEAGKGFMATPDCERAGRRQECKVDIPQTQN